MERLTKQMGDKYFYKSMPYKDNFYISRVVTKLGKLEDIEEELGIPLEVLFKALKEGIYCVRKEDERPYIYFYEKLKLVPYDDNYLLSVYDEDYEETFVRNLKDYGKTWSLTREELEND